MDFVRAPRYLLPAILLCSLGAFFEVSFVKVAVQLASNDGTLVIPYKEYFFAACAPIAYITYYTFFYFASVRIAASKLREIISSPQEYGALNVSTGNLYKTLSDDFVAVVELCLFPSHLLLYRAVIVLTLAGNVILMFLSEKPFFVVATLALISVLVFVFLKGMRVLASVFNNLQNARHAAISKFVAERSLGKNEAEELANSVSAIFPYKYIQNSMGGLMKPLVDFVMICFAIYLFEVAPAGAESAGLIAGVGATSWRMLGPVINLFVASGQIRYGYGQLNVVWKRVLLGESS